MFANLFHHLRGDAHRRIDSATLQAFDDRLLADIGVTRSGPIVGEITVSDVAASSIFPLHDVWSKHPVVRVAEPRHS